MKSSATELMKRLKYIESELDDIHQNDENNSAVPVTETVIDNKAKLTQLYETAYSFEENRKRAQELFQEEREIKMLLNKFNNEKLVEGYDFTVAEGLVRIAQLKSEIRIITSITRNGEYFRPDRYSSTTVKKSVFDIKAAKETLKEYQKELSALQVAVDRTNLNSTIEY